MATGPDTSFVGRKAEFALLKRALASAVAGSPRSVLVGGEAGVGKTRLVTEFSTHAQRDARVLTGRCFELSAGGLPYGPASEMLRRLARSLDETTRSELLAPAQAELGLLLPGGDVYRGWPGDAAPGSIQARFFELVLRFLGRIGRRWPVVLVVEDLHWADRSTLDLLTFLVHNLQDERVLMVGTYRSDELHGHPHLGTVLVELERSRRIQRIPLASFGREELAAQLRGILGTPAPATVVERIFVRSEGNAYFAEELLAAGMGTADVQLPPELSDVIMRRFMTLSEDAREVLRVVATAGRQVSHRVVTAASDLPVRDLLQALREAVAAQFLVSDAEDGTYSFHHELAREAVYTRLLASERVLLHGAIARALTEESRLAGDQATMIAAELAHHWQAADEPAKALAASVDASRLASGIYAFTEAQRQLERALELWGRVPDAASVAGLTRAQVLEEAADAAMWAEDIARALALVRQALAGVDPGREPVRAGVLQERVGYYLWRRADNEGALAALAEASRLFAREGASPEHARVLAQHGKLLMILGRYGEARPLVEQAVAMARTIGARREEGHALNTLGLTVTMLGDSDAGIAVLRQARRIAEEVQSLEDIVRAFNNLAAALENAGRLPEAADVMLDGLAVARGLEVEQTAGAVLVVGAANLLFQLGRWEEEEELLRGAPRLDASARFGPYRALIWGELAIARGDFDQAEALLESARSANVLEPQFFGPLYACLAELAIWRHDRRAARAAVRDGLRLLADSEDEQLAVRLCAAGLRAEADEAEDPRGARAATTVEEARAAGAVLIDQARRLIGPRASRAGVLPEATVLLEVCEAEQARLKGHPEPERWETVASSWERHSQPYRAAYAGWRRAEAMLLRGASPDAAAALAQVHEVALRLRAEPLRRELELLAGRGGIELHHPTAEARR